MPPRSPDATNRAIARLQEQIDDLLAFDVRTVRGYSNPEVITLSEGISSVIDRCFAPGTSSHTKFRKASELRPFYTSGTAATLQDHISERVKAAVGLLKLAQRELQQDLEDALHHADAAPAPTKPANTTLSLHHAEAAPATANPLSTVLSRRVFVVHGHDGEARETVARFLQKLGFEPVILHEQANRGGTVIEKIEANRDVGFAVVLLTPDDEGRSVKEEQLKPRARQNVLLELGYFISHLGRANVCALRRGDVDIPSDFAGVVWERMDDSGGWKLSLARELKAAGHDVDVNKAF